MEQAQKWNRQRYIHFAVLAVWSVITLLPLAYMFDTSVRGQRDILLRVGSWVPQPFTWSNYTNLFQDKQDPIARWFVNSAIAVCGGTLLTLLVASLAAYGFSRLNFPGRNALFYGILAALLIPGVILVIPQFAEFAYAGFIDTYWPLIIIYPAGPFAVFLLRQFYLGIPKELEEAAVIDGAGKFRRWAQLCLPLTRTPMLTLTILTFVGIYNDFFWPLVAVNSNDMRTVTVGIALVTQGAYVNNYGPLMAFSTIAAIPTVILFLILQRHFVASSVLSGVKG